HALYSRSGKFTPEHLAKVSGVLLDCPQFQIHSHATARNQGEVHICGTMADAYFLDGAAAAQVQSASQAEKHNRFLHARAICWVESLHGRLVQCGAGLSQVASDSGNQAALLRSVAENFRV